MKDSVLYFDEIGLKDLPIVGSKNASLGEVVRQFQPNGISVPEGFATTARVYRDFLKQNNLEAPLATILSQLDTTTFHNLSLVGNQARALLAKSIFPYHTQVTIIAAYLGLAERLEVEGDVIVRSSIVTKDKIVCEFATKLENFKNIKGEDDLLAACKKCFVALFSDRFIKCCAEEKVNPLDLDLSIGVQQMLRTEENNSTSGQLTLNKEELSKITNWSSTIKNHFAKPVNIEWMKDSNSGKLYVVQVTEECSGH
ncbi:MAG: PEP/pyruvate-binding domain-containing protein [Saprospiraceae bacterium]